MPGVLIGTPGSTPDADRHAGLAHGPMIGYNAITASFRPLDGDCTQPHTGGTTTMPTYVLLTTLTPEGVQTVKNNPQRILEVNKEVEQLGATVKAQWATLGHVDFISVVEAPDEGTMARVSLELGSRGTARYETLTAIPIDDFIASL